MGAQTEPKSATPVTFISLTDELARFREQLETESGVPIQDLEVNAALLLSDMCAFLGLGSRQRQRILGTPAIVSLEALLETRIKLTMKA